jgi:phosphate transport system permease protein
MKARKSDRLIEGAFHVMAASAAILPLIFLAFLLGRLVVDALPRLDWAFITSFPSRKADIAGILPALAGSFYLIVISGVFALPVGVGAAIYLEEYAHKTRFSRLIEINVANLAAVPSVIYGLLGLELFVRFCALGQSLIAGGLTLGLLILPIVITTSRESIRGVPRLLREASLSLGASRWQTIRQVVLPTAMPGIMTGCILSLSRALGEAAPLVIVGAVSFMAFVPDGLDSEFSALPIQIFNWISRPQKAFHENAAAAIITLMLLLLVMNGVSIYLRNRFQRSPRG